MQEEELTESTEFPRQSAPSIQRHLLGCKDCVRCSEGVVIGSVDSQTPRESEHTQHDTNDPGHHSDQAQTIAPPGEHFDTQQTAPLFADIYPDQNYPAQTCDKGKKRKRCAADSDDTDECVDATSGKSRDYDIFPKSIECVTCSSSPPTAGSSSSYPSAKPDSCKDCRRSSAEVCDRRAKRKLSATNSDDAEENPCRNKRLSIRRKGFKNSSYPAGAETSECVDANTGTSRDSDTSSGSSARASTSRSSPSDVTASCSYSCSESDAPVPGCSDEDDNWECPNSCLCKDGQPMRIRRIRYNTRVPTPLYVKLLQHRLTRRPNRKKYPCCDSYCSYRWPRRSRYEFHREYDESDLRVCNFSWGTWKEEKPH